MTFTFEPNILNLETYFSSVNTVIGMPDAAKS
jgi:hypothetical protein